MTKYQWRPRLFEPDGAIDICGFYQILINRVEIHT